MNENEHVGWLGKPNLSAEYLSIIDTLAKQIAEAVILGCSEIGMSVSQANTKVNLFDTTAIHAQQAVEYAIGDSVEIVGQD